MRVHLPQPNELALTPEFYNAIVKHGSDLITVLSREGTYLYMSDSISATMGYAPDELLGSHVLELAHPDDLPILQEYFETVACGGETQVAPPPFRYKAKSGKWHWLSCVATNMLSNPHVQGIVTNSRDITAKMEMQQKQQEGQAYYKALFFNNPDLVFTLSLEGKLEACNEAVFTLTGHDPVEPGERHFIDYVHPSCRPETYEAFIRAKSGQSSTFETCIHNQEGEMRHLNVTLVPVVLEGQVRAVQCIAKDTTNEKRANMLVKEQAQKLHNILESMTDAFFVLDRNWRYTFGNAVFTRSLNRSMDELMGRCIWDEYPWLVGGQLHEKCQKVVATGKACMFDERFNEMNVTIRFSVNPLEGGVSVTFSDITAQLAVQEELRRLSLVASKTTNGVIITDKDGLIEWVNEAFTSATGYTLKELSGKRPSEVLTTSQLDPREVDWIRKQLARGIPMREELLGRKKNGEQLWADVSISPVVNEKGEVIKQVYVHTDVTSRKLDQEQLLQTTEHLYLQNQDLQQFNYIVSHNLRAPVANLLGLSTMLQKLDRSSNRFELGLQNLEKSARRLDDVINDLNKILAVRSAQNDEARETVRLQEVATEVMQSLQHLLEQAGGRLQADIPQDAMLWANRAYVYSILHNLISNAIKYKSSERDLLIKVKSVRKGDNLVLSVEDNGSGMDLDVVRPRLFQLYKRFHAGQEGKGIGLYLVKMQVEAIGGRISVESKVEAGTTFTLEFDKTLYGQKNLHN